MDSAVTQSVDIDDTMRTAYLSYAMSVITARALPDVRDGLKPVQRRILYAMYDLHITHDQPTRKSARIVGEVLGKYHPHGDQAVYEAMARMAQDFSMRYPLVDGQGNFGSVDGDSPAAQRYTEARLAEVGEELLLDIDKNTVDLVDNFDGSLKEPSVLPARLPNLLLNGAGGIAVGMATNIPPHNLGEIADAVVYLVDHYEESEDVSVDDLMQWVKGPDFPTGGGILGQEGIRQAYATGKGRIVVRAQAHVEEIGSGRNAIIVTELPYQVNKARVVARIAELARDGRVEGVADLRDESDRTGMRVVIELRRGVDSAVVLGQLLKRTQMQTTFGANVLALVDGEPRVLSLKRILLHYIDHRCEVITRRAHYELERAEAREHILQGLLVALDNLDEVIETIRRSRTADTALTNLRRRFKFSEAQARAVLDLPLRRLAALERRRIEEEHEEILARIEYLRDLLSSHFKILNLVKEDVKDLKARFGDARRTRICDTEVSTNVSIEELAPDDDVLVALSGTGRVRRLAVAQFKGRNAKRAIAGTDRGALRALFLANTRETLFFVTDQGRAMNLMTHVIPDAAQQPDGVAIGKIISLAQDESVVSVVHVDSTDGERFLTMATMLGKVKRLALGDLAGIGSTGATVLGLSEGDSLVRAIVSEGNDELVLVTEQGRAIRFDESEVRPQGRSGGGVKGIGLAEGDRVVAIDRVLPGGDLLLVTVNAFAKRTSLTEYGKQGRGGAGLLTLGAAKSDLAGPVADARVVAASDDIILSTAEGKMLKVSVRDVPRVRRASWGRIVTRTRRGAVMDVGTDRIVSALRMASDGLGRDADEGKDGTGSTPDSRTRRSASTRRRAGRTKRTGHKASSPRGTSASGSRKAGASRAKRKGTSQDDVTEATESEETSAHAVVTGRGRTRRTTVRRPPRRSRKQE